MAEYIDRANLIARIEYYVTHTPKDKGEHYAYSVMLNEILNRPAADVALVKRAHWIEQDGMQICSDCGEEHTWDDFRAAYCDCCGAKMDGGEVDEP